MAVRAEGQRVSVGARRPADEHPPGGEQSGSWPRCYGRVRLDRHALSLGWLATPAAMATLRLPDARPADRARPDVMRERLLGWGRTRR